jgi:hypothetical protein
VQAEFLSLPSKGLGHLEYLVLSHLLWDSVSSLEEAWLPNLSSAGC